MPISACAGLIWADTFIVPKAVTQSAAGLFEQTIRRYRCNHRDVVDTELAAGECETV